MAIDWKYDILFSFQIIHPGAGADDFTVVPTAQCAARLKRLGLFFKTLESGGMVIVEKRVKPDGSAEALRPLRQVTDFTFLLKVNNPGILPATVPFHLPDLPSFAGRRRVLYLDNLNAGNQIDADLDYPPQVTPIDTDFATLSLAANAKIGLTDLASLAPNKFTMLADSSTTTQVKVEAVRPGSLWSKTFPVSPTQRRIDLDLADGGFRLIRTGPVNATEMLVAGTPLLGTDALGIIKIYKDQNLDFGTSIRYDIEFEQA